MLAIRLATSFSVGMSNEKPPLSPERVVSPEGTERLVTEASLKRRKDREEYNNGTWPLLYGNGRWHRECARRSLRPRRHTSRVCELPICTQTSASRLG